MLTDARAFMGEKKAMDVQVSPIVRPVEVTGLTSGEIVLADVNQSSDVRRPQAVADSTEIILMSRNRLKN